MRQGLINGRTYDFAAAATAAGGTSALSARSGNVTLPPYGAPRNIVFAMVSGDVSHCSRQIQDIRLNVLRHFRVLSPLPPARSARSGSVGRSRRTVRLGESLGD